MQTMIQVQSSRFHLSSAIELEEMDQYNEERRGCILLEIKLQELNAAVFYLK